MERRNFMKGIGLMSLSGMMPLKNLNAKSINAGKTPNPAPVLNFFKKESNEFKFINVLGKAHYKFADIGELLAIKGLTDENDPSSFVNAYIKFADSCKAIADDCFAKGLIVSARDAYMRASNYYFAATEYLDESLQGNRYQELFKVHRDCWAAGIKLMEVDYEEFGIPYEGATIKGFFIAHKHDKSKRPLCIFNNGSDGSILDCWTLGGAGMFERGYNLVTFDGPGQGSSLFEKNLYFRYDWEKVITPVVNSVIKRKEVDKDKIVLMGISQGGYWVPRAAAFEKRLKAIITDPGVTNVEISWLSNLPKPMVALLQSGNKSDFNAYMQEGFKQSPASAAVYNFRARPYGKDNPFDTYAEVQKYNLKDVAGKITCATIITLPDDEQFWPGQSQELYDVLNCPKQLVSFTRAEGGNYHCEPKSRILWEQKVLDKLDAIIKS